MKKRVLIILVVFAVVAIGLIWFLARDDRSEDALTLYGNVDIRDVALAFRRPGRIATVAVEEGDAVAPGDLVATLDEEPLREDLAAAEARVAVARARLELLEEGARPQEIEQAQAAVTEAEAQSLAAERDFQRKRGLARQGAASERDLEEARARRDTAAARLAAAREALDLEIEGFRDEDVAAGAAELRLALAQREQARTAVADARLVAPSPGTVLTRVREPGAMVAVGEPVAVLSLDRPVVVRAYVSEPHLGDVPPGTAVRITTDSSPRAYRGRVGFVSPQAEFTPKTVETADLRTDLVYRLRIVVEDPDASLLQGMPVTVHVAGGEGGEG